MSSSFLSFDNISFSYPSSLSPVFADFSVRFPAGWTGVTGPNGSGKSTLLRLAAGELEPDGGRISFPGTVYYCPQSAEILDENWQVFFWSGDSDVRSLFSLLEIGDDWPFRWDTLSGGEKKRVQTAIALAAEPDVLLMDEPTNHLDSHARAYILKALERYRGTGLLVSHDRFLMDSLCSSVLYLAPGEAVMYPGGVSRALELRGAEKASLRRRRQEAEEEIRRSRELCVRMEEEVRHGKNRMSKARVAPKDRDTMAKINLAMLTGRDAVSARAKRRSLTKLEQAEKKFDSIAAAPLRKEGISLKSGAENVSGGPLFRCGAERLYAGEYCLSIPPLCIEKTSRIAVTGSNGTGKTTLLHRIVSELGGNGPRAEHSVLDKLTKDLSCMGQAAAGVFYLPQEIPAGDGEKLTAAFLRLENTEKGAVLSGLYRLGSEPAVFISPPEKSSCKTASPGELRKLFIAAALLSPLKLVIMDEPVNHMDIASVTAVETALGDADCALLLVSHDRTFVENLTDREWRLERTGNTGMLTEIFGRI